ncbi:MAG: amidohydrolase family protein [Pirellulales bacterium]|nr:amidohydrolase family protein [Pirellulales bacterium]
MTDEHRFSRRTGLKGMGALGAAALLGTGGNCADPPPAGRDVAPSDLRQQIFQKVLATPLIDTHEHLIEEKDRLAGAAHPMVACDDWALLASHYLRSDLRTAGMPDDVDGRLFSPGVDPIAKWRLIEPYWPAVKNTGYGLAVSLAMGKLYEVDELSARTIAKVQQRYEQVRRPGFYRHVLCELAGIESCQVNYLQRPFGESAMPELLMQDLSIVGMFAGAPSEGFREPTGIAVAELSDWHRVIDWWFERYGRYAVAVKSQNAYSRDIDYEQVPAERAAGVLQKRVRQQPLSPDEQKTLEDHLFWYAVGKATEHGLPVKLHTGYYAGHGSMPLSRLIHNAGSACDLCRAAGDTPFVFMHIDYPYYEELIAVAKHYANAHVDMCWAWIINPVAAKDFLKKYLVTAPANKILTFGGDYIPVEPVLGHAILARRGIALALCELVEEGWFSLDAALELVDPIMHGNARRIFRLDEKSKALRDVPWA